jgi:hypothetical protein
MVVGVCGRWVGAGERRGEEDERSGEEWGVGRGASGVSSTLERKRRCRTVCVFE